MVFASTLFSRAVDPVIPKIAADLGIDVKTAALLSTAFTFPYAIMQPALGTIGDFFGKTRLMNVSLTVVVMTTLVCAFASNFTVLVAMRVVAGMLAGGIFPVGIAIVGDLVPVQRAPSRDRPPARGGPDRQSHRRDDLRLYRRSARLARACSFRIGGFGLIVAIIAFFAFRGMRVGGSKPFNLAAAAAGFRGIFADPRAKICFGSVFFEGHHHPRHVSLCRAAAARERTDPLVLCRHRDRGVRARRHPVFAVAAVSGRARDRAAHDAGRRGSAPASLSS